MKQAERTRPNRRGRAVFELATPRTRMSTHPRHGTLATAASCVAAGVCAQAFEAKDLLAYKAGPVILRPHLYLGEQYNDNLFYASGVRRSDFITVIRPSFTAALGRPDSPNQVNLTYTLDSLLYADNSDQNSLDHTLALGVALRRSRIAFDSNNQAIWASSIYGGLLSFEQAAEGVAGASIDRLSYSLNQRVTYQVGQKTSTYLSGTAGGTDFEDGSAYYDLNNLRGTLGFGYQAFTKIGLFGEFYYGQAASTPNITGNPFFRKGPHLESFGGFLGAKGELTTKLSGSVKVGYDVSDYADGSAGASSPVVEADLTARFTERTSATLGYSRRSTLSVQYSQQVYTSDSINLGVQQRLGATGRWTAGLRGTYGRNEYTGTGIASGASSDYFSVSASLSYQFRQWLGAMFNYEFQKSTSSQVGSIEYDVNRVSLGLNIGY